MKEPKYKSFFSSVVKPLVSQEKDKYLALASLDNLQKFLPSVDVDRNYDVLPIAFNACVVNRINKNHDVIDTKTALAFYKTFINKPINVEHERKTVVGVILTAGFSAFGSDEPLTEEEVKDTKEPFNIVLGGLIWRVSSGKLADIIEECSDPSSKHYMAISASWELGFTDYDIVMIEGEDKNIEKGTLIQDALKKEELSKSLVAFEGSGKINKDTHVYRMPVEGVLGMGVGITETPAADVKGILVGALPEPTVVLATVDITDKMLEDVVTTSTDAKDITIQPATPEDIQLIAASSQENNNSISQEQKHTVNEDSIIMKFTKLTDITDDSLKQCKASAVTDFIEEQLKEANQQFLTIKTEKEQAATAHSEAIAKANQQLEATKKELDEVKASLKKLQDEALAKAAEDTFNQRMALLDSTYELTDDDRKVLASQVKSLDEEGWVSFEKNTQVLLKEKNKEFKKKQAEAVASAAATLKPVTTATASTTTTTDVQGAAEAAVDNAKAKAAEVPATTTASTSQTLKEKYASAFSVDNFVIKTSR